MKGIKNQCFTVKDKKMILCQTHAYYYQIQLQLLLTEANFCDFVLDAGIGNPHIERIFKNDDIQTEILFYTYKFWKQVMIPEYFIMKVPCELLPVVL